MDTLHARELHDAERQAEEMRRAGDLGRDEFVRVDGVSQWAWVEAWLEMDNLEEHRS